MQIHIMDTHKHKIIESSFLCALDNIVNIFLGYYCKYYTHVVLISFIFCCFAILLRVLMLLLRVQIERGTETV